MTVLPEQLNHKLTAHLSFIYPDHDVVGLVRQIIDAFWPDHAPAALETPKPVTHPLWSEKDAILITYGDSIRSGQDSPLSLLNHFYGTSLSDALNSIHILPFFPYTSDDGFAVSDYGKVDSNLGDWGDINKIANTGHLMADLVLNHASSHCAWFQQFRKGEEPGKHYFATGNPEDDLSDVVRPRPYPLLHPIETPEGTRYVWCTFSPDQVDLDFTNPDVLVEFIRIMRLYMDNGVRIFRMDAVAFLWKEPGSTCIHLPQTHEIIKLMRTLVDFSAQDAVLITETNVPNHENLSYFGNQNEAHMIYNFSLPPLILHALLNGTSQYLRKWMMSMPPAQEGCAYFNFTASHDGIGLRPAEGLLPDEDIQAMIEAVKGFGARLSTRAMKDGTEKPYEINVALFDAMRGTAAGEDDFQVARFLCSQTIMMALEGIPAFYIHSLLATPNDVEGVERTRHNRTINRHKWDHTSLQEKLQDPESTHHLVFNELRYRIKTRTRQRAFHPNATQFTLYLEDALFGIWRQSQDRKQSIFSINNLSPDERTLPLHHINLIAGEPWHDLLSGAEIDPSESELVLKPYQSVWITNF